MAAAPDARADAKAVLRRRMRLAAGLVDDRVLRSIGLWARLAELDVYRAARTVMAFASTDDEPDTDSLAARLAAEGRALVLPSLEGDRIVPRHIGAGLLPGRFGIRTPQGDAVPVEQLDLVVVPGVAFTVDGWRLGRGGGHYDRFLAALPASCATVGVCFAEQVVDELPVEAHDVRLHAIVTDVLPE